jgi:hypothetical protein
MDAKTLPGWLWPIATFAGVGAFIDFLIGRGGADRVRDFLETWWIKFDDVRWNNFGQKEAMFAIDLIDRWCGRQLWSWRRWIFVLIFFVISIPLGHLIALFQSDFHAPFMFLPIDYPLVLFSALSLGASVSLTRLIAVMVARLCGNSTRRNVIVFALFLLVSCVLTLVWLPAVEDMSEYIRAILDSQGRDPRTPDLFVLPGTSAILHALLSSFNTIKSRLVYFTQHPLYLINVDITEFEIPWFYKPQEDWSPYFAIEFTRFVAGFAANLIRLAISLVFVGSFLLRPIVMRPLLLVWLRIVESDKPIFTLIFGGASATAVFFNELKKHL